MFDIKKPCIRQCCLDEKDVCMGCYRTLDDMRVWHKSTDIQKLDMLRRASEKKEYKLELQRKVEQGDKNTFKDRKIP